LDYALPGMSERTLAGPSSTAEARSRRFRVAALVVVGLAAGLILWLVLRDDNGATEAGNSTAVSVAELRGLAESVRHPVFWVGPKDDYTYELTRNSAASIVIRYLPPGVDVGADEPYLTVATYPFPGAFAALNNVARDKKETAIPISENGVVVPAKGYPQSVHAAYPDVDYQVEVFDPSPGAALHAVTSGELQHLGLLRGRGPGAAPEALPAAASRAELTAFATSLGHPVYWAGARSGNTYEVTQDSTGRVFIRYLPPGVAVGSPKSYLTVATYPFPGALGALQALAKGNEASTITLPGGGLAIVDMKYPKSIHLAYPASDYQVEVFAPSAAAARRVVESGRIAPVG
jgi:hypothetical protein